MSRLQFLFTLALMPLAAAAAARGSAAPITNPCKLLTQTEVSTALGARFGAGQLTNTGAGLRCRFLTASGEEVFIDVVDPALFDAYAHAADATLTGIGDKALWEHSEYGSYLYILKSGNLVTLGLPRTVARLTPALVKTGKLIAKRM